MTRFGFCSVGLAMLVGCGGGAQQVQTQAAAAPAAEVFENLNGPVTMTLENSGSGDRQLLRYSCADRTPQRLRFDMTMAMSLAGQRNEIPQTSMNIISTQVEQLADGSCRSEFAYENIQVSGGSEADEYRAIMRDMFEGMRGEMVMTPQGMLRSFSLQPSHELAAEAQQMFSSMSQTMTQMSAPFPTQPVAVGASWKVESDMHTPEGLNLHSRTVYTLVAREGDTAELESVAEIVGAPGSMQAGGQTAQISELSGAGRGRFESRLDRATPDRLDLSTTMHMQMSIGSQAIEMDQESTMHLGSLRN